MVHLTPAAYSLYDLEADNNGRYPDIRIYEPLKNTYEKLKKYGFGYPHDSYIINFEYMTCCTAKTLKLAFTDNDFTISRNKMKEFLALKTHFFCGGYAGAEDDTWI